MRFSSLVLSTILSFTAVSAYAAEGYVQQNFVANKKIYAPSLAVDRDFINAWGIAIRPAGAGGHFWVTAKDVSYEYVGDVSQSETPALRTIHQDDLKEIRLPVGGPDNFSTGVVFSDSKEHFVITQKIKGGEPITAPAKFLFSSDGGIISAWTERKKADGSFDRALVAENVIDQSAQGAQFFGLAISEDYDRLYAADFGAKPTIKVFEGDFKPSDVQFETPFDANQNGRVDPGEFAPFNIQSLTLPDGATHLFVTYAKTQPCPVAEIKQGTCKKGELFVGEEDTAKPGYGRLAEFTEDGELVAVWKDNGLLSAPWGLAVAPDNFGALSGMLIVGNFGDGTMVGFDPKTREAREVLRDAKGKPMVIDKLWGLLFGNGQSLGDADALYFAAGPKDEADGVFGSIRAVSK